MAEDEDKQLSSSQLSKIKRYLSDAGSLHRAIGTSLTNHRRNPKGLLATKGNIQIVKTAVWQQIQSLRQKIYDLICVQFEWCKKRKQKKFQLAVAIVKILLPLFNRIAGAIANIVLMITEFMFDELCECDKASTS
ncbi:MAG TPA: hypothetical protein VMF32_04135 [Xanthobacteraceae bacterium]|nr:hypothetical protein [Xanthobacteraceae bacterium]